MAILSPSRQLKKELSLFGVYTLATGATLGSGFFLLPGLAADVAGPAVVLSYLLAVVPILPGILSKIELATAMPRAGGEYYFIDRSLGPLLGTISGFGTWCGLVLKTAFALIGIGAYLGVFFPNLPMTPFVIAAAFIFGFINLFGARQSGLLQVLLVLMLLLLLVWFTTTGLMGHVNRDHFSGFWSRRDGILAASGLVCVSFMGLTNVASVAEEVKDPERNLPLGIFLAMVTAVAVYGLGTIVIVGVVPPETLYTGDMPSLTPVAEAAGLMAGQWATVVMTVAAILAFFSVANAGILSASRYPLAMSRDHLLPRWFRYLSPQKVPRNAVIVTVGLLVLFVVVFDPTRIAKLASAFLLLLFAFNCVAVLVMRASQIESYDPGYRCPFYPWIQFAGIIGPMLFIAVMGWLPILFSAGLVGLGAGWYFYYARPRVARSGAIYHLFARLGQRRFEGLDRELRSILKEKGLRADDPYDQVVACASVLDLTAKVSFEQVVYEASRRLADQLGHSAEQLSAGFMEGTRVGATPVSKGVALPHLRLSGLGQSLMVLCRVRTGVHVPVEVDFVDHFADQAIYTVIFLISSDRNATQHLRILAQVAQHVDQEHFMDEWLAAENEQQLKEILLREDRFLRLELRSSAPSAALVGGSVGDLSLPEGSLIVLIHRGGQTIFPRAETVLEEGDHLTIVGLPQAIGQLKDNYQDA